MYLESYFYSDTLFFDDFSLSEMVKRFEGPAIQEDGALVTCCTCKDNGQYTLMQGLERSSWNHLCFAY